MKKKLLALAFCLPLGFTQAQNMLTNGDFESYNTLPTTCPTLPSSNASTLPDVNSWSGNAKDAHWDPNAHTCAANSCTATARVVYETRDVAAGDLKLDVSRYAKGVYFVIGKTGDDTEKQKFIVE